MDSDRGFQEGDGGAYGDALAHRFHLQKNRCHVTRSLKRGVLAVTQIKSNAPTPEPSQSIGYDEAYLIGLMVGDVPDHELWQDGRAVATPAFRAGHTALYDLRRDPVSFTRCAHHSLHVYMPRAVLKEVAARNGLNTDGELGYRFAHGHDDPVVRHLGMALMPALDTGGALEGLFLDQVLQAMATHVLLRYGDTKTHLRMGTGGLAAAHLARVQEMMRAGMAGDVTLIGLADACGLSPTHFARAFRRSTGQSPHAWLQQQRIAHARHLLKGTTPLSDIALACGFSDQSHFTRVFTKLAGISPGRWRRTQR